MINQKTKEAIGLYLIRNFQNFTYRISDKKLTIILFRVLSREEINNIYSFIDKLKCCDKPMDIRSNDYKEFSIFEKITDINNITDLCENQY